MCMWFIGVMVVICVVIVVAVWGVVWLMNWKYKETYALNDEFGLKKFLICRLLANLVWNLFKRLSHDKIFFAP